MLADRVSLVQCEGTVRQPVAVTYQGIDAELQAGSVCKNWLLYNATQQQRKHISVGQYALEAWQLYYNRSTTYKHAHPIAGVEAQLAPYQ